MIIYDFFAGTGSATQAFQDAGHIVIKVELDEYFEAHERNLLTLTADGLIGKYGRPDFIWASPPCTTFSVASIRHYWVYENGKAMPKNKKTVEALEIVAHTVRLIQELNPRFGWLMENPRGLLRKQDVVKGLMRHTVSYCQYGASNQKPTDLWGVLPTWRPRPMCSPGDKCHESAPRGAKTGTQGIGGNGKGAARKRAMVAPELGRELLETLEALQKDRLRSWATR